MNKLELKILKYASWFLQFGGMFAMGATIAFITNVGWDLSLTISTVVSLICFTIGRTVEGYVKQEEATAFEFDSEKDYGVF